MVKKFILRWLGITDISIEIERMDLIIDLVEKKMLSIETKNKKLHTEIGDVIRRKDRFGNATNNI